MVRRFDIRARGVGFESKRSIAVLQSHEKHPTKINGKIQHLNSAIFLNFFVKSALVHRFDHLVNQTVFFGLLCRHEEITIGVFFDFL